MRNPCNVSPTNDLGLIEQVLQEFNPKCISLYRICPHKNGKHLQYHRLDLIEERDNTADESYTGYVVDVEVHGLDFGL
jgi:hypothetical protein